jgi:hypothetical protein
MPSARGLFLIESGEEADLHDLGLAAIKPGEAAECFVERQDVDWVVASWLDDIGERFLPQSTATLVAAPISFMVDQDASHRDRGESDETSASAVVPRATSGHAEEGLVSQRRGLQGVAPALAREELRGEPSQRATALRGPLFGRVIGG